MDQNLRQWASTFPHLSCCHLVSHLYFSLHCLCCSDHPVAFVRLNLGSLRSDHHSWTDLLLIFDCLGFYPLVLGFARHYYPFYLLVLLLSLSLLLFVPVLCRMCFISLLLLLLFSLRFDHHSSPYLLLIFDCLGFYPLVLGFARHYYPFYLLVLLLSLALHLVGPVLGRMCLIPPHPLLLGFLLPPALHPVSLDPL